MPNACAGAFFQLASPFPRKGLVKYSSLSTVLHMLYIYIYIYNIRMIYIYKFVVVGIKRVKIVVYRPLE